MVEDRNEKVKGLEEFSEYEMDRLTTEELIELENRGYKKVPDYMYKNILSIYLQELSRKHN